MGKLRHEIQQMLLPGEEIYIVLQAAGASKSSVSNAKYSRDAWRLVIDGKIAEQDFWKLGFHQCRALSRLEHHSFPLEVVLAGEAAGLEHEEIIALGKWDLRGRGLHALAKTCAARGLGHCAIVAGAATGVLPKSNVARIDALGTGCNFRGPGRPVSEILRWSAKVGGPEAIAKMDVSTVRNLGDTFLPLLPILHAITKRLRKEKVLVDDPEADRGKTV